MYYPPPLRTFSSYVWCIYTVWCTNNFSSIIYSNSIWPRSGIGVLPQRIGVAEQTAQTVAFHQYGAAVGKHPLGQLVVVIVIILLGTAQHVGYLGIAVVIGKTPFLTHRSPVAQHLAGRGVMVVFVFGYQSCRIRMRHHQIVFIAEATFDVAVAADDADQVAAAIVFVADCWSGPLRRRRANPPTAIPTAAAF